jgi:hypothetical protein
MSWHTLSWAIFLNAVLFSTASGSIGLNYRKNGVINAGLAGLMYLGGTFSSTFTRLLSLNPYWSVPVCILVGGFVNIALNIWYLDLLRRYRSPKIVSLVSLASFGALYLIGRGLFWYFLNQRGSLLMISFLLDKDFTLFTAPGVIIIGTATLLFYAFLQFVLNPVVDGGPRGFNKWDIAIYALSGATVCLVGALYPFWFTGTWQILLITPLAGFMVGGMEKTLNPFLGGLFTASFTVWFTSLGRDVVGLWTTENPYMVSLGLLLISIPLYPRGIVGSIRRIVEHGY